MLLRTPYALVDDRGRIFALLCGRPGDKDWGEVLTRAANTVTLAVG